MLEDILIATNIVLILTIILSTIVFLRRKNEIKELKAELLDAKLISSHAPKMMAQRESEYQKLLYTLAKAMKNIRDTDQEIGGMKKSLGRFYSDLVVFSMMSSEAINDKNSYRKIIHFLETDLENYLQNKTNKLDTDKFFQIIESIEMHKKQA
jgi:ABC-type transporter Mla subunit MlaD